GFKGIVAASSRRLPRVREVLPWDWLGYPRVFFSKEWFYCLRTGNMALHLKDGEKLGSGIRRIAKKEIGAIIEHLAGRRLEGEGRALHEARKNLKKVRATLRLVREQLGEQVYQRENRDFRDVARALSLRRSFAKVFTKTSASRRGEKARATSRKSRFSRRTNWKWRCWR